MSNDLNSHYPGDVPLANKMMYGERAITVTARLGVTRGGGKAPDGAVKLMAALVGFADEGECKPSESEYEVWDCTVIIVPKRIYRNGPFKGHRMDQVAVELGGDMSRRFKKCETVKPHG